MNLQFYDYYDQCILTFKRNKNPGNSFFKRRLTLAASFCVSSVFRFLCLSIFPSEVKQWKSADVSLFDFIPLFFSFHFILSFLFVLSLSFFKGSFFPLLHFPLFPFSPSPFSTFYSSLNLIFPHLSFDLGYFPFSLKTTKFFFMLVLSFHFICLFVVLLFHFSYSLILSFRPHLLPSSSLFFIPSHTPPQFFFVLHHVAIP